MRLDGKTAIITGAASGIGAATARLFIREGARVILGDIQDEKGASLAAELGPNAIYQHIDVTQEIDIKSAIERAVGEFGRLDCMYNNAGFPGVNGDIETIDVDDFDLTVAILLRGPFLGIKHAAPVMIKQGYGSIISTASVAALQSGHAGHLYSMCKAGVLHLTRTTATELGEHGVRVNCICPGGIATPIFAKAFGMDSDTADKTVEPIKTALARSQPIKRAGLPEDVAHAALWLASDDSSFVNGHALTVDGGLTAGRMWSEFEHNGQNLGRLMMSIIQPSD